MLFNSLQFLYGFLPVTYLLFWRLKTRNGRFLCLAVTGYLLYSFWDPRFCLLMAFTTAVSYVAGLGFLRWHDVRRRRLLLIAPISIDLAVLAFFKYTELTFDTATASSRHQAWNGVNTSTGGTTRIGARAASGQRPSRSTPAGIASRATSAGVSLLDRSAGLMLLTVQGLTR